MSLMSSLCLNRAVVVVGEVAVVVVVVVVVVSFVIDKPCFGSYIGLQCAQFIFHQEYKRFLVFTNLLAKQVLHP